MSNGQSSDSTDNKLERIAESLEVLTDQVGRLTEGLTEFRIDMVEIKAIVEKQAATAERQEVNITRLVAIVEVMIQQYRQ